MKSSFLRTTVIGSLLVATALMQACSPVPRRELSKEDKQADMLWLYSQFNDNYAPLNYKESRFNFNYENLKASYLKKAEDTSSNDEFYALMHSFVSEFKDAHTSSSLNASPLPGRTNIAYIGISGRRVENNFEVTSLLPGIEAGGNFPISAGDQITKIDGVPLKEVVDKMLVQSRNLGNDEANYTYHFTKLFTRSSLKGNMPVGSDVTVTVLREDKTFDVTLPWIKSDIVEFVEAQKKAEKANEDAAKSKQGEAPVPIADIATALMEGRLDLMPAIFKSIDSKLPTFNATQTFSFIDDSPVLGSDFVNRSARRASMILAGVKPKFDAVSELTRARNVPSNAMWVREATTYPTYITSEPVLAKDGTATGARKLVAYMYLDTFSPENDESTVLAETRTVLNTLIGNGVTDLVIDMIDNGGGSLSLGLQLAQLFANKKMEAPGMQFALSETWLDEFQSATMTDSDYDRELAKRVFKRLLAEKSDGKRLSSIFSSEELLKKPLRPNTSLGDTKLNIVLLVNEMCASMCDIFSGMMQDNNAAVVMGTRSMGAGGNVVNHTESPNSHIQVRQTESLIVRKDGSYVENNGTTPEYVVNVNKDVSNKYSTVRAEAVKLLTTKN